MNRCIRRVPMKSLLERFEEKYIPEPTTGCWLWIAGIRGGTQPYGSFSFQGKSDFAHRVSYRLFVSEIPDGLEIDHLCRVTLCVNPRHLEAVTHRENMLRGEHLGKFHLRKTHCPQEHPYAGDNLRIAKNGGRLCRACNRAYQKRVYYAKKRITR